MAAGLLRLVGGLLLLAIGIVIASGGGAAGFMLLLGGFGLPALLCFALAEIVEATARTATAMETLLERAKQRENPENSD